MSKSDPSALKKERNRTIRWVITIFLVTILVSGVFFTISEEVMSATSIAVSFCILLVIVFLGIIFDVVGVAVTSANETPFHSMAARKVPGAKEALLLLRNAERVSSICNDVIGDICGVVSGSAAANIAAQLLVRHEFSWPAIVGLALSSIVSAVTVGGKAVGKTFAVNSSTQIVYFTGKVICFFRCFTLSGRDKKRK